MTMISEDSMICPAVCLNEQNVSIERRKPDFFRAMTYPLFFRSYNFYMIYIGIITSVFNPKNTASKKSFGSEFR